MCGLSQMLKLCIVNTIITDVWSEPEIKVVYCQYHHRMTIFVYQIYMAVFGTSSNQRQIGVAYFDSGLDTLFVGDFIDTEQINQRVFIRILFVVICGTAESFQV